MKKGLAILLWAANPRSPHLCSAPFFHSAAAAAMDAEVEMYFSSDAVELLKKGVADALPAGPQARETVASFMAHALQHGVKFFACPQAMQERGLQPTDLIEGVQGVAGAATFVARALDEDWATLVY